MKRSAIFTAITVTVMILGMREAWACSFDTDCQVGAKCVKSGYSLEGVCVGDLDNKYGGKDPKDTGYQFEYRPSNSKKGKACSFDTECGVGGSCLKDAYSINGVCSK